MSSSNSGRPPKPTKMKILHGTLRADRVKGDEMAPGTVSILPKPPAYLDQAAKKTWAAAVRTLQELDMLVEVDFPLLAAYCHQVALVEACAKKLKRTGLLIKFKNKAGAENTVAHPLIKIHNDALNLAKGLAGQFGFTPSARVKISVPTKEDSDGFDAF